MSADIVDHPAYQSLTSLKESVEAFTYLADITPDDDADKSVKTVLAKRLKSDFDKHYVDVLKALFND